MPKSKKSATASEAKTYASGSKSAQRGAGGGSTKKSAAPAKGAASGGKTVSSSKSPGGAPGKSPVEAGRTAASAKEPDKAAAKAGGGVPASIGPVKSGSGGKPGGAGNGKADARASSAEAKPVAAPTAKKAPSPQVAGAGTKGAAAGTPPKASASGAAKAPATPTAGKVPTAKASKKVVPEAPPKPAVPRKFPKGGPGKAELRKYRAHLLELRRGLLASSKDLAAEALKSSSSEFTVDRTPDSGADNYEQDFSLQLLEGEAAQLADIREALLKIDGKIELPYGVCEACSDTDKRLCETCPWIPASRLDVMPHARLCVQTKEIEERRKQR